MAGQTLNSFVPRGVIGSGLSGLSGLTTILNPSLGGLTSMASFSPRLMGELAYGLGRTQQNIAPILNKINPAAFYPALIKND